MITNPPNGQLLDTVAASLAEMVAPAVSDPEAALTLQLAIAALGWAAARSRHELRWMQEEIARIEADAGSSAEQPPPRRIDLSDVPAHYTQAGELLNSAIDAAFDSHDPELLASVEALLSDRLGHEAEMLQVSEFLGRRSS